MQIGGMNPRQRAHEFVSHVLPRRGRKKNPETGHVATQMLRLLDAGHKATDQRRTPEELALLIQPARTWHWHNALECA